MEATNPFYIPFDKDKIVSENNDDKIISNDYYELEKDNATSKTANNNYKMYGNRAFAKNLQHLINSENDLLKYEYIEIVKNGKEEEHLQYLLTSPEMKS